MSRKFDPMPEFATEAEECAFWKRDESAKYVD